MIKAVKRELSAPANPGRAAHSLSIKSMNVIYRTRELLAELFRSPLPENFILTPNATYGLNFAIKGILSPGDEVITTHTEHNSVLRPLKALNARVTLLPCDRYGFSDMSELPRLITPDTRLIIINHSSNVNGVIQNISAAYAFASKYGVPLLVDASQTAGLLPIDVKKTHMAVFPGHKGLYGPQGTGALYISPEIKLRTIIEGGTGSNSKESENPLFLPDRFESGTLNCPGFAGLSEGLRFVMREGVRGIYEKEHTLLQRLMEGLSVIRGVMLYTPEDLTGVSGLLSFNIAGMDSNRVADILNRDFAVAVRPGLHCAYPMHTLLSTAKTGTVRVSLSYFNTKREINAFLKAVSKISK